MPLSGHLSEAAATVLGWDPAWTFIGALLVLHWMEGLYWVRREAIGFVRRGRGYRVVRAESNPGNGRRAVLFVPSLPPLEEMFVVEPWPLLRGAEGLRAEPAETWLKSGYPTPDGKTLGIDAELRIERTDLVGPSGFVAGTSSEAMARHLLGWLGTTADRPAEQAMAAAARTSHDTKAIEARIKSFRSATGRMRLWAPLHLLLVMGGAYGFFFVQAVVIRWPILLGAIAVSYTVLSVEFWWAHRRLYPERRGERWLWWVMLILSPPAPARARQWLARDLLAPFHPLAVAMVLLNGTARERFASTVLRALAHPVSARDPDGEAVRKVLDQAHRRLLRKARIDASALIAPPPVDEPECQTYCPRCAAPYRQSEGECPDCPGVGLVPVRH